MPLTFEAANHPTSVPSVWGSAAQSRDGLRRSRQCREGKKKPCLEYRSKPLLCWHRKPDYLWALCCGSKVKCLQSYHVTYTPCSEPKSP